MCKNLNPKFGDIPKMVVDEFDPEFPIAVFGLLELVHGCVQVYGKKGNKEGDG
jgi:hypothetical protein